MPVLREFREFALKGNVVDLAVGVIIGAAFGTVVKSLVDDILMPVVGLPLGGVDFSDRFVVLRGRGALAGNETLEQARSHGATVLGYGKFLNNALAFLIVAWAVFLLVKAMNRLRRTRGDAPSPVMRQCPHCATDIPVKASRCPHCTSSLA